MAKLGRRLKVGDWVEHRCGTLRIRRVGVVTEVLSSQFTYASPASDSRHFCLFNGDWEKVKPLTQRPIKVVKPAQPTNIVEPIKVLVSFKFN